MLNKKEILKNIADFNSVNNYIEAINLEHEVYEDRNIAIKIENEFMLQGIKIMLNIGETYERRRI